MVRPHRSTIIAAIAVCCLALLTVAPVAVTAQQSPARLQTADGTNGQPVSTCFSGSGYEFTVGSDDGARIWVRLHAAGLTGSGWSIGAEMVGSIDGTSIIEVVAGIDYVGDGFVDLLSNPADAFDLVSGFDFQLPMLEGATTGLDGEPAAGADDGSTGDGESASASEGREASGDSPFEMLRC